MSGASAAVAALSDEELMRRVQFDDRDAFSALYQRFARRVYSVVHAVARDPARAEDAHQEAFLSIWRSRASYDPGSGSVGSWIMGTARKRAIDGYRHHRRHDERRADDEWAQEHAPAPGEVAGSVTERDEAARLRRALTRLPEAQRHVIALAYFGELSATEISARLSVPLGTVKGRMRLGLEKLRDEELV